MEFSVDTVIFDTVFTQIGSITKYFKVYNPYSQPILVSSILLQGGSNSNFRINIDGVSATAVKDVEIQPKDSLFIFAEVTVDPNNLSNPMIITDEIVFITNGNQQNVKLAAWGQDAYFWFSQGGYFFAINQTIDEYNVNYVLPTDKPHVVYGYLTVDSTNILTLPAGLNMHFHQYSGLAVDAYATLKVEGTIANPVTFTSDRLDFDYRDIPGQWGHPVLGGIWLSPTSMDNEINYAIIRNGNIGLGVDSVNLTSPNPTLRITNTIIENMSGVGLFAKGASVVAENCVITNCGQYTVALAYGGDYQFDQCTFANYWTYTSRDNSQLLINNYYEDVNGNIQNRDITKATFNNCIIYGVKEEEIALDETESSGFQFEYQFNNCLLKTVLPTTGDRYVSVIVNPTTTGTQDPVFFDPAEDDYHLFDASAALNKGMLLPNIVIDIEENTRDATPDLGAYEYQQ